MATSTSRSSHFFKILLHENVGANKLEIPKKFLSKYRDYLPDKVFLKIVTGEIWMTELEKRGEEAWLQNGWQEFATHYSLDHGYLVIFGYDGNSIFDVLIFDKSASEIDYSLYSPENEKTDGDTNVEIIEGNKTEEQPQCSLPHKRKRAHEAGIHASSSAPIVCTPVSKIKSFLSRNKKANNKFRKGVSFRNAAHGTKAKRSKVNISMGQYSEATLNGTRFPGKSTNKGSNNPYFIIRMCQSYKKRSLAIPINFSRKYMERNKGTVILQVDHRSWPVNFCEYSNGRGWFHRGWHTFVEENALEPGDICMFEMISSTKNVLLDVTISRSSYAKPFERYDTF